MRGLVDSMVAGGYYRGGGTPEKARAALVEETGGKVDVWCYAGVSQDAADFKREFERASLLGARQILFWGG